MDKQTFKRHLISALITFLAGFGLAVLPELNQLSPTDLTRGTLLGLAFAGFRGGLKGLIELVVIYRKQLY